eukprot:1147153-Pelagomonas_calceolata.AAC.5
MAHPHTHIACSGPHIHLLLGSGVNLGMLAQQGDTPVPMPALPRARHPPHKQSTTHAPSPSQYAR